MKKEFQKNSKKGGVYQIKNLKNQKVYIGSAKCFQVRASQHESRLNSGKHHNKHLFASWNKYGSENFLFEILEVVDGDKLQRTTREQHYIDQYLDNWEMCYNLTKFVVQKQGLWSNNSEVTKRKLSKIRKGKTYEKIFGEKLAKQMKKKQSRTRKNIWTDEKRKEYSEKFSGKNNPFFGQTHTEKTKRKISQIQKGKSLTERLGKEKAEKIKAALRLSGLRRMQVPKEKNRLGDHIRGKTLEEIYGPEKAKEIKEKRSKAMSKTYEGFCLLMPTGEKIYKITNMYQFCKKHNLHDAHLRRLLKGKLKSHKGWILL